jgi:hypothetical protein
MTVVRATRIALGVVLLLDGGRGWAQQGLPRDATGWTVFTPSSDSRLIYVSSSTGNDATGQIYSPTNSVISADPFNPVGPIMPFATISNAMAQARSGYPDWVLLKRGDTWSSGLPMAKSGRSASERSLVSAYGASGARPLLKSGLLCPHARSRFFRVHFDHRQLRRELVPEGRGDGPFGAL